MTSKRHKRTIVQNIRSRILSYLEVQDHPVSPREIARKLNIKQNSVRPRLLELLREGKVSRPYRGFYLNNPIHGVGKVLPKVHNLVLSLNPYVLEEKIPNFGERLFGSHVRIQFGVKRQRVTWYVSNVEGLNLDGLRLCLEVLRLRHFMATEDLVSFERFEVSTVELNQDFHGVRWDRSGCVTLKSFLGSLERIYQRGSLLRSEVKVRPQSLMDIYTLLKGGVTPFNVVQTQMMLVNEVRRLTEAVKGSSGLNADILALFKEILARWKREVR